MARVIRRKMKVSEKDEVNVYAKMVRNRGGNIKMKVRQSFLDKVFII